MLIGRQDKESEFLKIFLRYAINGDLRYVDIVSPILLECAEYANGRLSIMKFDRVAISQKLMLIKADFVKDITPDNLMLKEALSFMELQE